MEDLAKYIRSFKAVREKPPKASIPDTSSIDTNELLSEMSSEASVKPTKVRSVLSVQQLKQQRSDKRRKGSRRTPLKVVQEEDEMNDIALSSYNLSDYLPREDFAAVKTQPSQGKQPVRLKRPYGGRRIDVDAQSAVSSVDTEALLQSSDEEDPDDHYALPRSGPPPARTLTPQGRSATSPSQLPSSKVDILEAIRNRTVGNRTGDEYGKPPLKETRNRQYPGTEYYPKSPIAASPYLAKSDSARSRESDDLYGKSVSNRGMAESYQKTPAESYQKTPAESYQKTPVDSQAWAYAPLSPHHAKRETADFRYQKDSADIHSEKSSKSISLSYTTQQTFIPPARRLSLVTVSSIYIHPTVTTHRSRESEFSLNDPLQSSRKCKIPSVPDTVRVYSSMASVPMDSVFRMSNSGPDSARSRDSVSSERATQLQVCTCILAGVLEGHLPGCRKIIVPVILPVSDRESLTSSAASLPYKPTPVVRPTIPKPKTAPLRHRLSLLEATIRIQRAYRRYLRLRKPVKPTIREIETWTLEEPMRLSGTQELRYEPRNRPEPPTDHDTEHATRSLYNALDQLRMLRDMASNASSQETSFTLSESAISREVTPGQSRLMQVPPPQQVNDPSPRGSMDDFQPGEGETSIDTDILLRSSESLDFT